MQDRIQVGALHALFVCAVALLVAFPCTAFGQEQESGNLAGEPPSASDDLTAQAAPFKLPYATYQEALNAFLTDGEHNPGAVWNTSANPPKSCGIYVMDYENTLFPYDPYHGRIGWTAYTDPSEIRSGDWVSVDLSNGLGHSLVVLGRDGSTLDTIEGNYDPVVTRTTSRYKVEGSTFYEWSWGGWSACRFKAGYHPPLSYYDYDLNNAYITKGVTYPVGLLKRADGDETPTCNRTASQIMQFVEQGKTDFALRYGTSDLTEGVDFAQTFKLAPGDAPTHRMGLVRFEGLGNFRGSSTIVEFSFDYAERYNYLEGKLEKLSFADSSTEKHATVTRLAGDNALDTMKKVVEAGAFPKGGTVVLASVEGYWDALTAAGIAGLENAPVVMTWGSSLAPQAESLLKPLAPSKIVVCGGTGTVSDKTASAAKAAAGAKTLVRAAGNNAAGTAIDIFEKGSGWSDTAVIATVGTYHDALAAAPLAYANKMPIFLADYDWSTGKGTLSAATLSAMKKGGITRAYVAGGGYWISDAVATQLSNAGITLVKRLAGDTAVETSTAIAAEAVAAFGMSPNGLGMATTATYHDALAGAALCGKNNSVLLLADGPRASSIADYAWDNAEAVDSAYVFGGSGSVSNDTFDMLLSVVW